MSYIRILGAQGSRSKYASATCLQITPHTLIDAGNIMRALGDEAFKINKIFFSHAHLDHIIDTPFIIDNFFAQRQEPLYLYGLPQTIRALKEHIFNWDIWPDFSHISLLGTTQPSIVFVEIEWYQRYEVEDNIFLTPFPANHTIDCCGYIIEQASHAVVFAADSYTNSTLWEIINHTKTINALIIDVSFPNALDRIAKESKHLTPQLLQQELELLQRKEVKVYINHIKPFYRETILEELLEIGISEKQVINDGELIALSTGDLKRTYTHTLHEKIEKLNTIGTALSNEKNLDVLLEMILTEAKSLANADAGTLYLVEENALQFKVAQTDSLGLKQGGTHAPITWDPLPLILPDGSPNITMVAPTCALEDRMINIADIYASTDFSFEGAKRFDAQHHYRSQSMLLIPLKDHEQTIVGVIQLLNKIDPLTDTIIAFDEDDESLTRSLASQAAIAIANTSLIQGLEVLLESFLKSIIYAISKKSPYTAKHTERVVHLSLMFAKAIDEDETIFKDKHFSAEDLQQINFAALMHDIGKLATPEYIVDKATKLETIFDRITLVKNRVEVIQHALHVKYLHQKIETLEGRQNYDLTTLWNTYLDDLKTLNEALDLIQHSNTARSVLSADEIQRIEALAYEQWEIEGHIYTILTPDEAYHLCTQRGTLTPKEREIINEHAHVSLEILSRLPFPKKYQAIPQISANHHERINGKGYPRGLKGDEISFEAQILAISDIFEALTASDRPYKPSLSLSKTMHVLHSMVKEGELDKDLVEFFYTSGIYRQYAMHFLPEQHHEEISLIFDKE